MIMQIWMTTDTNPWYEQSGQNNTNDGIAYNVNRFFLWSCCKGLSLSTGNNEIESIRGCAYPMLVSYYSDDVIKWKHFPRYWTFVRGIYRSPVNFPHKGQPRGALMFCLICAWINGWVNNREAGDLRRHRAHYYVTIMHNNFTPLLEFRLWTPHIKRKDTDFFSIAVYITVIYIWNIFTQVKNYRKRTERKNNKNTRKLTCSERIPVRSHRTHCVGQQNTITESSRWVGGGGAQLSNERVSDIISLIQHRCLMTGSSLK